MDFHSLSRRELQALCKKNKIPANLTNVAMADSLKSLEIVEGTDEVLLACQSGMARLSIKSRGRLDAASPQMNTKKVQTASACRKMNSLLKECAQEEKTPGPSGFSSRRRRAATESSSVQGTRRSARLAEKSAKLLKENGYKNPDFSMNLIEIPDGLDEISGVTDVSASTNSEENSVMQDEEQADSAWKQGIATDVELVTTVGGAKPELNESRDVEIKEKEVGSHNSDSPVVDAPSIVEENPEKHVVFTVEEVELEPSDEGEDVETKDREVGSNNLDLAGLDGVTIVEENPGTEIQSECSAEKQVISTAEEVELGPSNEAEMSDSERDGANLELKESIVVTIEQVTFGSKIAAKLDGHNEAQEIYGSVAIEMSENVVENDPSDQDSDPEDEAVYEYEGSDAIEMSEIVVENDPSNQDSDPEDEAVDEWEDDFPFSEDDNVDDKDSDLEEVIPLGVNEEMLEYNTDLHGDYSEMESNPDESNSVNSDPMEESTKTDLHEDSSETESNLDEADSVSSDPMEESSKGNDSFAVTPSDIGLMRDVDDAGICDVILEEVNDKHLDIEQSAKQVSPGTVLEDAKADAPEQTEIVKPEEFTAAVLHEDSSEMESNPDESDSVNSEPVEDSTKNNDSLAVMPSDLMNGVDDAVNCDEKILVKDIQLGFEQVSPGTLLEDARADAPEQTEIVKPEDSSEMESNHDESDSVNSEPVEESTKSDDSLAVMPSDLGLMSDVDVDDAVNCDEKILVKDIQLGFEQVSPGTVLGDARADAPEQTEIVQFEEKVKLVDEVPLLGDAPSSEEAVDGLNLQNSPTQQLAGVGAGVPSDVAPQASLIIPPTKTPVRASAVKKRMLVPRSDNKENIVSGSKTMRTKERSKEAVLLQDDEDQAIMQLAQKVEKLEITKKLDKSKGGNEVSARPPLQAISRN